MSGSSTSGKLFPNPGGGPPIWTADGRDPLIRGNELRSLPTQSRVFVRIFTLDQAEQLSEYQQILNDAASGAVKILEHEKQYRDDQGTWHVFISFARLWVDATKFTQGNSNGYSIR